MVVVMVVVVPSGDPCPGERKNGLGSERLALETGYWMRSGKPIVCDSALGFTLVVCRE